MLLLTLGLLVAPLAVAQSVLPPSEIQTYVPSQANTTTNTTTNNTTNNSIGLRTLIIGSTNDSIILPKNVVHGYGSPFDVIVGSQPALDKNDWHSIVVADSSVNQSWVRDYAARTHARVVFLQSIESADDATVLGVQSIPLDPTFQNITVANTTNATHIAGVLNVTSSWNVSETSPSAVSIKNTSMATPFLVYNHASNANASNVNQSAVAAFVAHTSLGTEELHFRFQAGMAGLDDKYTPYYILPTEYTQMNLAFGHSWYEWVTRGVFLGYRRLTLNIHVDDWFINSGILYTDENWRINDTDVETYVAWKKHMHESVLPKYSDWKLEPAYNGAGLGMSGYTDLSLNNATYEHAGEFDWISHTWTHMNMDWLEDWQCNGKHKECHPLPDHYDAELGYNQKVARGEGITSDEYIDLYKGNDPTPPHQFLDNRTDLMENHYSVHSLVTPEISGLWPASYNGTAPPGRKPYPKNSLFFSKLVQYGIKNVVGDNSRPELNAENMYHGVISSVEEYGTEGILIIPRWSPNIPFNCRDLDCAVRFYQEGACGWTTYGAQCDFSKNWTGPEVINREAKASTIPLLQQRWDPYMFHQANVHAQPYRNGSVPMVGQFVQDVAEDVLRYVTGLPFVSIKMDDLGEMYRQRMARDEAGQHGVLTLDASGKPVSVEITGDKNFTSVLTITSTSPLAFAHTSVHHYGPDQSAFKEVIPNQPAIFNVTGTF